MQVNKVGYFRLPYGLTVVSKFRTVSFDTRFAVGLLSHFVPDRNKPHRTTVAVHCFLSLCCCC